MNYCEIRRRNMEITGWWNGETVKQLNSNTVLLRMEETNAG